MKKFFTILLVVLTCVGINRAHAIATIPDQAVWITPADAKIGDSIEVNALVYNDADATISVLVGFTTNDAVIGNTSEIIIPAKTAKVATVQWKLPETSTVVTATITKASSTKKDVVAPKGLLGTVTIGGTARTTGSGILAKVTGAIEGYREHELQYFTALLVKSQAVLGAMTIKEVAVLIKGGTPTTSTTHTENETDVKKSAHTIDYVTFGYASAGKAFFSHKALYYVVLIVFVLFIIRFIVSRLL